MTPISRAATRWRRTVAALASALAIAACGGGGDVRAEVRSTESSHAGEGGRARREPPGYVIDSVLPPGEALRRFREGLRPVDELSGGTPTRDALVERFVSAVERRDTAALRRLELDRSEFAFLVYPSSIYTRPPYEQQPDVVWMLQRMQGDAGLRRVEDRFGGRRLRYRGYRCADAPMVQGTNLIWRDCVIGYTSPRGDSARGRLFGAIVERAGHFKFVNYANDL